MSDTHFSLIVGSSLVTKRDLEHEIGKLRAGMGELRSDVSQEIDELRADMRQSHAALRPDLQQQIFRHMVMTVGALGGLMTLFHVIQ